MQKKPHNDIKAQHYMYLVGGKTSYGEIKKDMLTPYTVDIWYK